MNDAESKRRSDICRTCADRPVGCWKAVEFDCDIRRKNYETSFLHHSNCPIGHWDKPRVLIALFSAKKFQKRLDTCLATWLKDAQAVAQPYKIVQAVGGAGDEASLPQVDGHFLHLALPDNLISLPGHLKMFCHWALREAGWDYVFKCDDDTYISIPRFLSYHPTSDYEGGYCNYHGKQYAHGGGGYFISRKAVEYLACGLPSTGSEDLLVGDVLRANGITCKFSSLFEGWGTARKRPRSNNDTITTHTKKTALFYACYAETGLDPKSVSDIEPKSTTQSSQIERFFFGNVIASTMMSARQRRQALLKK